MGIGTLAAHVHRFEFAQPSVLMAKISGQTLDALAAVGALLGTLILLGLGVLLAVLVQRWLTWRYRGAAELIDGVEAGRALMASVGPATVRRLGRTTLIFPSIWRRVLVARHVVIFAAADALVVRDTLSAADCTIPWSMIQFISTEVRVRRRVPWYYLAVGLESISTSPLNLLFLAGASESAPRSFAAEAERIRVAHNSA